MPADQGGGEERQFGPYRLIHQIATGGMAEIHLAKTRGIGGFEKFVALKMIHPNFSSDEHFIQMLIDEAKISVQLQHVNIAHIFDLGRVGNHYYIAMEYVDGCDLFKILRKASEQDKSMPIEMAVYIAKEVCTGLDYAHRKRDGQGRSLGIVHRDISPQNVLVSNAGEVKVVDFGIAKATMRARQTAVGVIKGKYYYMSPEQAWGDPLDHRTDIFSAGILLYEMLTGQMLYLEEDMKKLLDMVRKADIPPPSTLRPDVPRELDRIVMRALAKKPVVRWQSAQDFGAALERFLHGYAADFNTSRLSAFTSQVLGPAAQPTPMPPKQPVAAGAVPTDSIMSRGEFTDENSLIFRMADFEAKANAGKVPPDRQTLPSAGSLGTATSAELGAVSASSPAPKPNVAKPKVLGQPPARVPERVPVRNLAARLADSATPHVPLPPAGEDATFVSAPPGFATADPGTIDLSVDSLIPVGGDSSIDQTTDEGLPLPSDPITAENSSDEDPTRLDVGSLAGRSRKRPSPPGASVQDDDTTQTDTKKAPEVNPLPLPPLGPVRGQSASQKRISRRTPVSLPTVGRSTSSALPLTAPLATPHPDAAAYRWPQGPGWESDDSLRFKIPRAPDKRRLWLGASLLVTLIALVVLIVVLITRPPPAPNEGSFEIISIPSGARLNVDGRDFGTTPATIEHVALGQSVHLKIALDRYDPWERDEKLTEARSNKVVASLKAIVGVLRVTSAPLGADVFLNNKPLGSTPLEKTDMDPFVDGVIEVRKTGYKPLRLPLTWQGKREALLKFDLLPAAN